MIVKYNEETGQGERAYYESVTKLSTRLADAVMELACDQGYDIDIEAIAFEGQVAEAVNFILGSEPGTFPLRDFGDGRISCPDAVILGVAMHLNS